VNQLLDIFWWYHSIHVYSGTNHSLYAAIASWVP